MLQPRRWKRGFRGTNSLLGSRRCQPSPAPARLPLIQLLHEGKAQQLYKPGSNCSAGSEAGAPRQVNKRKQTNRGRNKGNRDGLVITELLLGIYPPSLAASWLLVPVLPLPFPTLPLQQAGAAFPNAVLAAAGNAALLQSWRHLGRLPPPPFFSWLWLLARQNWLASI